MATAKKTSNKKAPAKAAGKTSAKAPAKAAKLERHPLSEKYGPKMSDEELSGLAADIKAHGQHEHIIMFEGKVLAGWNRYEACLEAKVEPKFRDMEKGANPTAVAFGTNFMRRKLGSVQKAFYGAQFCIDAGLKQTDVAKQMGCSLNRLNQCCQLLKLDTDEAKKAIAELRDNSELSSATFDEMMLELGIVRESKPRPAPARASAGGGPLDGLDDDDDPLGSLDDGDDLTGGAIDSLLGNDEDLGDEESPSPATRKGKGSKPGEDIGDDAPLPAVGGKRTSQKNPHETPVSRVASAFKHLSPAEQRTFIKFAWGKLKAALDEAISHGDVQYETPAIKPDPSLIARKKPADGERLDDGAPTPAKKSTAAKGAGKGKPAPKGKPGKSKPTPAKKAPPAKPAKGGKHATAHDEDI